MLLIHTLEGSSLCWGEIPCHLGMDQGLWESLPPQISTIPASTHLQRVLEQAGNSPFVTFALDVTVEKLLFIHVLLLQTWMSSTTLALCSSGSHSEGECGTGIALLRWWRRTKSTPSSVTHRCKDGGCTGSMGCLGREVCSDTAVTARGGSGDKGKDLKGAHGAASAACSGLPREEWSPPHALAFCQPAPLSLLYTHTF